MSNLTTRPTRSRVSSPFVSSTKILKADNIKTKMSGVSSSGQSILDGWVEPVVPPQRPSYADAGIERHGVVQNMAPLGSRPSLKILKATALLEGAEGTVRPLSMKKTIASNRNTPMSSASAPDPTISFALQPESASGKSGSQMEQNPPLKSPEDDSFSLDVHDQTDLSKQKVATASSPLVVDQMVLSLQQSSALMDTRNLEQDISQREFSHSPIVPPATGLDGLPLINLAQTDRVVELAVQDAVEKKRWPTAYALRTLYDDNRGDISFIRLLEAVYYRYATEKDLDEFERLLKPKKNEGKKDRTGELYFCGDGNHAAARSPIYSAIKALNPPAPAYVTPYNSLPALQPTLNSTERSKSGSRSSSVKILSRAPSPSLESGHVHKKPRRNGDYTGHSDDLGSNRSLNIVGLNALAQKVVEEPKLKSRSMSTSSSSSLSSVDVNLIEEVSISPVRSASNHGLARLGLFGEQPIFISPYANANNFKEAASCADTEARSKVNPSAVSSKSGPKIYTFSVNPPNNNAEVQTRSSSLSSKNSSTMPLSIANSSRNDSMAPTEKLHAPQNIGKKVEVSIPYEINDENSAKRRQAKNFTNCNTNAKVTESFERSSVKSVEIIDGELSAKEPATVAPLIKKPQKVKLNHNTRQKTIIAPQASISLEPGFRIDIIPGSPNNAHRSLHNKEKSYTGLRVKTSPIKKKAGTNAGIPRGICDRNSPIGNNALINNFQKASNCSFSQDDNDDFCASCGGNGEVVCCDGDTCKRSFHFKCVDPPIMPNALPETWFCNECQVKRSGHREEKSGLFRLLLRHLEEKNPGAFSLPLELRGYFESVKTGPDGEYEEIAVSKTRTTNRAGWEEAPDYFKKRDNKGKPILCHACGLQAETPNRVIIPCSFCNLYWHLDCVELPLAKEPAPGRLWKCQAHIDDLLRLIPDALAPAHRFRKIKGLPAIQSGIPRGLKNHGHIEVENETTDSETISQPAFYEERPFGRTHKVTEESIKLEFLTKVKKEGGGYTRARFGEQNAKRRKVWSEANFSDQQAALNLSVLANSCPDIEGFDSLINTLLAEAPLNVINMIALGDADNYTAERTQLKLGDKASLIALKEYINIKLNCLDELGPEEPVRKKPRNSKDCTTKTLQ
ncbi:BgTH12-00921 [Blumeria graminis f. sp. triticale]|uniref:BgTH12-00921 n=1 Tax=Blumeria graminis f. sp. triticale TaxID=1689686 RepID=A0A9W4GJ05_BLUGR|nr:BgTH12-00921 [Blumeria graminis f. sp. triticale]